MAVMTGKKLAEKCIDIAKNYKTLYVMGCIGAPLNGSNVEKYVNHHSYNQDRERASLIRGVANKDYFGFDCVCLIKSILWGWKGDTNASYGGATYKSNNVPDINADAMIKACSEVSTNFSKIEVGEVVWMKGHIGVYIGDGLAVECTPIWAGDVQITAVGNIGRKSGYNTRTWTKHGKLPYVSYSKTTTTTTTKKKSVEEIAKEVIKGEWGVGAVRKSKLTAAGYDYDEVQAKVNELCNATTTKKVTKGCKVKVKKGAKAYDGTSVADFVYKNVYTVDSLSGKRAVLDRKGICTAFNIDDLIVQ